MMMKGRAMVPASHHEPRTAFPRMWRSEKSQSRIIVIDVRVTCSKRLVALSTINETMCFLFYIIFYSSYSYSL
jgi:hypothetical protein